MNKKIITIVILIMMVLSALFMFRRPWLNSNQEALDYMNAHYSFDDGTIEKLTYLQKKHSIELGDYMQYYVTFENGKKSIIRAYVKMHNHLTMIGPDFYIKSWHWPCFNVADIAITGTCLWLMFGGGMKKGD